MLRIALSIATVALLVGCGADADRPEPRGPREITPGVVLAVDKNPDPNVFELDLEARIAEVEYIPGVKTKAWTYNGTVPGPLVDAKVGDTLIVHFKNSLPEPTTIHWHGIRLPNAMDGAHVTQNPVLPGGTFEYKFKLRDPGLYWFHPHHRSDSQIERGLQGIIRVRAADEPKVDEETIVVLDDVSLKGDGSPSDDLDDFRKLNEHQQENGRVGPLLLVNGRVGRPLRVRAGAVHRFRFLITSNLRFFNLEVPGHVWRIIGSDGGFFEKPIDTRTLMMGPAERYDVLLLPKGAPGATLPITSPAFPRGEDDPQDPFTLTNLEISREAPLTGRVLPDRMPASLVPPRIPVPKEEPFLLELDFGTHLGPEGFTMPVKHGAEFERPQKGDPVHVINKLADTDIPDLQIPLGATRTFRIWNRSHHMHLFHLHGFFMQIVDSDDRFDAAKNPWGYRPEFVAQAHKDTVVVRSGYSVTVVAKFDEPGKWMYHCHVPEHSEHGMQMVVDVK